MGKLYSGPVRGTWTPALTFATPGDLTVAYSTQQGRYRLRDGIITLDFAILTSTFTHTTAAGNLQITGMPLAALTDAGMLWSGLLSRLEGVTKASYTQFMPNIASAATFMTIAASGSAQASAILAFGDLPTGTAKRFNGSITYPVA